MALDINREQLAWAAGFFDGEGSFLAYISHRSRDHYAQRWICVQVSQVHPEVLYTFQAAIGGFGNVRGPNRCNRKDKANCQPTYIFRLNGVEKTQLVASMLWPWLGSIKKQQYKTKMEQYLSWGTPTDRVSPLRDGTRRAMGKTRYADWYPGTGIPTSL